MQYHDVVEFNNYDFWKVLGRLFRIVDVFWNEPHPTDITKGDINSIGRQSGLQFHLVGLDWQVLPQGETADLSTGSCSFPSWAGNSTRYNVTNAVDLYGVDTFDGGTALVGWGQRAFCYGQTGLVAIQKASLLSPVAFHPLADSQLIAHELHHYSAALPHVTSVNLMNNGYGSSVLTSTQQSQARTILATDVFPNASNDYNKDR